MSTASVHIVLSDKGWILETLASKLKQAIPFLDYDTDPDPSADIQYYMTYATANSRISQVEIGYFAHIEQDEATRNKFFDVARKVDFCVCHSQPYEKLLREHGIDKVQTIPPGVDLQRFVPKIKIGVVGRTYHTGRKGERIIAGVIDLPGIEWHFTGTGWPGPPRNISEAEMPDFYRSMDYILVPSLYEGGPMSVIEALACGCEVIAPPVGWVPEFPHIEYKTGDIEDLRRVLQTVVEKRLELRRSVLHRGWETWIEGHRRVFEGLGQSLDRQTSVSVLSTLPSVNLARRPGIIVHGSETGVDKGGPSVRAPTTVKRLSRLGYDASLLTALNFDQRNYDLYHIFNLSRLASCRRAIEYCRLSNSPVILSTIYLNPSERKVSEVEITEIFKSPLSAAMISDEYARIRASKARRQLRGDDETDNLYEEFHAEVRHLINMVDHVICLSEYERTALKRIGADLTKSTIVRNPVNVSQYASAQPDAFRNAYGISDYILCVGRLEPRKNQITLLHALRDTGLPIVVVGHAPDPTYKQLLRSVAGPNATFIERLPPNSQMIASAFAGARVFCLPSWSEGAPLAALEAAAAGCNMVLSDRSSESEYFGDRARYCDPGNPEQMAAAIQEAYEQPLTADQRRDLSAWVAEQFSWEKHVNETAAVYEKVKLGSASRTSLLEPKKFYVDLTSGANRSGPPSGIARVEERYALDLYDLLPGQVVFIVWNSYRRAFLEVSHEQFVQYKHKEMHNIAAPAHLFNDKDFAPYASIDFVEDSILLVLGGAWIRNENYIQSLAATKRVRKLSLVVFVHDVIQGKFKHWFPENIGNEFVRNCRIIVNAADHIIVNSQCTLDDLRQLSVAEEIVLPPADKLRFGDEIEQSGSANDRPQFEEVLPLLKGKPFVLYVSALDIRKNHMLLYNVWERMIVEFGEKTPPLIMVGSKGWNIDHFLEQVASNVAVKKVFHILHGINDATLSWLYRHCLFTVYPSHYEGWGLPVAESLNYGKVCVAARAGSVPEVAPHVTDLIDPLDFPSWYRTITSYVFNPKVLATRREHVVANYKPITWRKSAADLREILMKVHRRGRPLPVVRIGVPLGFDDQTSNQSRQIKVGGWYSPEKEGTWSLGPLATLQFRLEGRSGAPLVLELAGRGFVGGRDAHQLVTLKINGTTLGKLKWSGEPAADMIIISQEISDAMLMQDACLLEFHIDRPLVPAVVRQGSTDARQLGIMVGMIGFRTSPMLPLNSWIKMGIKDGEKKLISELKVAHKFAGGRCYKLPCAIGEITEKDDLSFSGVMFLGVMLGISKDAPLSRDKLTIEARLGDQRLGEILVSRDRVTTHSFAVPHTVLKQGVILELSAMDGPLTDFAVIQHGIFPYPVGHETTTIPINEVISFTIPAGQSRVKTKLQPHFAIERLCKTDRQLFSAMFSSGWSRYESGGIWSDGDRACLLLRPSALPNEPFVLSYEVRAYRAMWVSVRINGAGEQRWKFNSGEFTHKAIVYQPRLNDRTILCVEFEFHNATPPSELEGSSESRQLGIMLSSLALITLEMLVKVSKQPNFPQLQSNAPVNCTSSGSADTPSAGLNVSHVIAYETAWPMLISGWGRAEKLGCWSDGDIAAIFIKPAGESEGDIELDLTFNVRPYKSKGLKARVNGGDAQPFVFKSARPQQFTVKLPRASFNRGYLVVFEIDGATSPSEVEGNSDERRLGICLKDFVFADPAFRSKSMSTTRLSADKQKSESIGTGEKSHSNSPGPNGSADISNVPALTRRVDALFTTESTAGGEPHASMTDSADNQPATSRKSLAQNELPAPIVVDFSRPSLHHAVSAREWYGDEVHGRWSYGASGYIDVEQSSPLAGRIRVVSIIRLDGSVILGNRSVSVFINGVACGAIKIKDDAFRIIDVSFLQQVPDMSTIHIEYRCDRTFCPIEHGVSDDNRQLGIQVRGLVIAHENFAGDPRLIIPGSELLSDSAPLSASPDLVANP